MRTGFAQKECLQSFQTLRDNLANLKVKDAIIDGELVCLDAEGRSIFNELLHRKGPPTFYAFDLLYLNGRDLRQLPLVKRKLKLRQVIGSSGLADVICGKYVEGRGVDLFNEVCQRNLEGVVAKRKTGKYATASGWLKIKNPNYTQSEGRHELFDAFKAKARKLAPVPKNRYCAALVGSERPLLRHVERHRIPALQRHRVLERLVDRICLTVLKNFIVRRAKRKELRKGRQSLSTPHCLSISSGFLCASRYPWRL